VLPVATRIGPPLPAPELPAEAALPAYLRALLDERPAD
jgi:hypothetical protein